MLREDRRTQLLTVAQRILRRDGVKALTMERLSEEGRISKPVVYSHFENRSDLIVAILEEHWAHVDAVVPQRPEPGESFEHHLRRSVAAFFDVINDNAGTVHTLYRVLEDPVIEEARHKREQAVVAAWIAKTTEAYNISKKHAEVIAHIYRAALEGAAIRALAKPSERAMIEAVVVQMGLSALQEFKK
jgi:AcrR family transcriptional regulator